MSRVSRVSRVLLFVLGCGVCAGGLELVRMRVQAGGRPGWFAGINRVIEDDLLNRPTRVDPTVVDVTEPALRVWRDGPLTDTGGTVLVQSVSPRGVEVELPEPKVEGLVFVEEGKARVEAVGERLVITRRFTFTGKSEMYELPPLVLRWADNEGPKEVRSAPLWLDLGVEAPRPTDPVDITEPAPVRVMRIERVLGAGFLVVLLAGGLWVGFGSLGRAPQAAPPPPPADVRALRAWEAVLANPALDDNTKAIELSRIFREYTEEVLGFPATAWTTTQTVAHLEGMVHLPKGNVPRAKRLLRATDLVKFAEHQAGAERFAELDADLRAFLDTTRVRGAAPVKGVV